MKFSAWTFGDQVPGPTLRARVDDKIRFSTTNRSDESLPGAPVIAASSNPSEPEALKGKLDFESKCLVCHSLGQGPKLGPDLLGVTKRRSDAWTAQWLKSPETMLVSDEAAKAMLKEYKVPMPNQNLNDAEVKQYIRYFHWADEHVKTEQGNKP